MDKIHPYSVVMPEQLEIVGMLGYKLVKIVRVRSHHLENPAGPMARMLGAFCDYAIPFVNYQEGVGEIGCAKVMFKVGIMSRKIFFHCP